MNKEQQRKEFEEWALDKVTSLRIDEIDAEYFWVETHLAWEAWQAAQKGLTEQRDGLRSGIDYASDQLTAVTEQRDRLAEALHVINTYDPKNGQCDDGYSPVFHARKALQSLTPNEL
jgi:hypothetical protein